MEVISQENSIATPRRRWGSIAWLLISQFIGLLSFLPWLMVAGLAVMAFDSGYSTEAVLFVGAIWIYPVVVIGTAITAWILFALKKVKAALIVTSLIVIPAVLLIGYFGFMWVSNILGMG